MSGVELSLAGALALGAFSTLHCGVMCGGLAAAQPGGQAPAVFAGRVGGYALLGAIAGAMGGGWQRVAAGVSGLPVDWRLVMGGVLCALALWQVWRSRTGMAARCRSCSAQSRLTARVRAPLLRGVLWAALPCPTLYLTGGAAMLLGDPLHSAAFMAAFALATTPALLLPRWVVRRGSSSAVGPQARSAAVLAAGGVMLLASAWALPAAAVADWCRRLVAG